MKPRHSHSFEQAGQPKEQNMSKVAKAIHALKTPDASLQRVPNTVRQSIADVLEQQQYILNRYGLALMMIREGADNHKEIAANALADPNPRRLKALCGPISIVRTGKETEDDE